MKNTALRALLAAAVMAPVPVMAQTPPEPAVAATLPNAFASETPAKPATRPAPQAMPAPSPEAAAPDIARAETALREVIANLRSTEVDYTPFSADLAEKIRPQVSQVGSLLQQFGEIKTIRHLAQPNGVDVFRVDFENQATEWMIGFDSDDQIAALLFRPVTDTDAK